MFIEIEIIEYFCTGKYVPTVYFKAILLTADRRGCISGSELHIIWEIMIQDRGVNNISVNCVHLLCD